MKKNRFGRRKNEDTGRAAANKRWAERLWTGLLFLNVFTVLLTGCSRGAENEEGLKTQGSIARTEAVQEGLAEVTYAAKFHLLPKDRWQMHANACYYDGEYYCRELLDTQEGIYGIGKVGFDGNESDWIVKIKNYGKDVRVSTQAQEPINRMMIDVLGEEPPDLIDVSLCFGTNLSPKPKDLMEQGYVENLYPYLEKVNALSVDDLEEKVLEYFEVNGKLVTIPRKYSLRLLLVDGAVFGDGDRWSVEEMMEYDRLHPDKTLFTDCTAESVLPVVLLDQLESFVSIEQKSVNLDHALFRESLKYAASYPDTKKEIYFSRDDQLVKFCTIEKWIDVQCLQKEWYEGRGKLVGYPTVDGSFRTKIMPTGQALAICSKSKNKEGAWRFLEFFLEDDQGCFGMDGVMKAGFPVNKKILRRMEEEQSAENGPLRTDRDLSGIQMRTWNPEGNGEYYSLHPITAEERQMVKKILEGADVREMQYFDLKQMVREECEPYFAGQKSLEETIRVIQNRVNLYLQE